jgi:hypothetical protein
MTTRIARYAITSCPPLKVDVANGRQRGSHQTHDEALEARGEVMFLHVQRSGVSQLATVNVSEIMVLFHDGVLMPITRIGRRHAKQ